MSPPKASAIEPVLIGKRGAALALGVSVRTAENLITNKQLPARKIGRRTLIPYGAVIEFARHDHPTNSKVRQ
jgi:excisionase family DNA binding protein